MNVPGRPEGNWTWRSTEEMLSDRAFEWLREMTAKSNRLAGVPGSNVPLGIKSPDKNAALGRARPS
jgi:hypothetical protein